MRTETERDMRTETERDMRTETDRERTEDRDMRTEDRDMRTETERGLRKPAWAVFPRNIVVLRTLYLKERESMCVCVFYINL